MLKRSIILEKVQMFDDLLKSDPIECGNKLFTYFLLTRQCKERAAVAKWFDSLSKQQRKSLGE